MKKILLSTPSLIIISLLFSFFSIQKSNTIDMKPSTEKAKNVLGTELQACCYDPMTGWFRDGSCNTAANDIGTHVVCAEMTNEFLNFSAQCGNDLKTPMPAYNFPGLKPGDKWCLCVSRWKEAMEKGLAPPVILNGTHQKALETVTIEDLKKHELK